MTKGFWKKLKNKNGQASRLGGPILALAPMADVTDAAFRRIIAKYGKPDVMFTEFVSCDGLCSKGKKNLLSILKYTEKERPIVAQVFGAKPENFYESAKIIKKLGFDGIDINMGCPDKKVLKQGAGASLINNQKLAQEIIRQTKRGAGKIPVSVKTRIGYDKYDKKEFKNWLLALLKEKPAVITIHCRTKKEMSLVPAHWGIIAEAVKIRNKFDPSPNHTLIFGNGDVQSVADAEEKARASDVDGVMIGRAIFGKPWLFAKNIYSISLKEKLSVLLEHTKLFEKINKGKNFDVMKKHFKSYVSDFPRAKKLRIKLMNCKNAKEVEKIILNFKL